MSTKKPARLTLAGFFVSEEFQSILYHLDTVGGCCGFDKGGERVEPLLRNRGVGKLGSVKGLAVYRGWDRGIEPEADFLARKTKESS